MLFLYTAICQTLKVREQYSSAEASDLKDTCFSVRPLKGFFGWSKVFPDFFLLRSIDRNYNNFAGNFFNTLTQILSHRFEL